MVSEKNDAELVGKNEQTNAHIKRSKRKTQRYSERF